MLANIEMPNQHHCNTFIDMFLLQCCQYAQKPVRVGRTPSTRLVQAAALRKNGMLLAKSA
jgi:hypothetical protein